MTQEKASRLHSVCKCGVYCDTASYDSNTHVNEALKEAYKNNQDEIDYI